MTPPAPPTNTTQIDGDLAPHTPAERSDADARYFGHNGNSFTIIDHDNLATTPDADYVTALKSLHSSLVKGDPTGHHEVKLQLPRSLHGLRVAATVSKITALNPIIQTENWSSVTADITGNTLILTTFTSKGVELLKNLKELKMDTTKTTKVPDPTKPNNKYYVDILMPLGEWEIHPELLGVAIRKFPSIYMLENPNADKPLGSKRLFRLYFKTTTAPREVFTEDNDQVPIREVTTKDGAVALIIHKWNRLNTFPPPSLSKTWQPRRSYAAAMRGRNPQQQQNPQPSPPARTLLQATTPVAQPAQTQAQPASDTTPPTIAETTPQTTPTQNDIMEVDTSSPIAAPIATNTPQVNTTAPQETNAKTAPAPARRTDTEEWVTVENPRSSKTRRVSGAAQTQATTSQNRFEALELVPLDQFEDAPFTPLAIIDNTVNNKPHYKNKKGQRTCTSALHQSLTHAREIRHPAATLSLTNPVRGQYLLMTESAPIAKNRARLRDQIAHLRAIRNGVGKSMATTMLPNRDTKFLADCQALLHKLGKHVPLELDSPISSYIEEIAGKDQPRLNWLRCYAQMDLLSRFFLPHLYSTAERPKQWAGSDLHWIYTNPDEPPLLSDGSLWSLATNTALQTLWETVANGSPQSARALSQLRSIPDRHRATKTPAATLPLPTSN